MKPKLLLDANISWRLVVVLEEHFGEYARENGYIIITHDDDFSDFIGIKGFPPKMVLLKTGNNSKKVIAELLIKPKSAIWDLNENEEFGLLEIV